MKTITITADIKIPVEATDEQIEEWVSFNLHERASCSCENPLVDYDMDAVSVRF